MSRCLIPGLASVFAFSLTMSCMNACPANAADDGWSVLVTPQMWLSHISKNGFVSRTALPVVAPGLPGSNLVTVDSQPTAALFPQWGGQIALQKAPWTFAIAGQYVSFETRNDIRAATGLSFSVPDFGDYQLAKGQTITQEFVEENRFDLDLTSRYLLRDVIQDRLDIYAGLGFKFIYASGSRHYTNTLSGAPIAVSSLVNSQIGYYVCSDNLVGCGASSLRQRASVDDHFYGAILPWSVYFYPTANTKWVLPLNVSPFLGAETRNDHGVVYAVERGCCNSGFAAKRLDGTTFAYGMTADAGVRYVFENGIALSGAFRVQLINGHASYLAWGPMFSMSVRFGH